MSRVGRQAMVWDKEDILSRKFVANSDLIIDLGMNNGDDTEFYLKRARRVVAVEANPALCTQARARFRDELASGRLEILNLGIWSEYGNKPFYLNLSNDHWSSFDRGWAGRDGTQYAKVDIDCVPLSYFFARFGVPHYLKIDVEGADNVVIQQLAACEYLPLYLSLEDCRLGYEYIDTLSGVGYTGFKLLDQSAVPSLCDELTGHRFRLGSSGPFGEQVPGEWLPRLSIEERYALEVRDRDNNRMAPRTRWWDIHCRGPSVDQGRIV